MGIKAQTGLLNGMRTSGVKRQRKNDKGSLGVLTRCRSLCQQKKLGPNQLQRLTDSQLWNSLREYVDTTDGVLLIRRRID